ncbi:MAG: sulfate/molybdate ABC transporter ATP-binding protein [Haloechinothrix sp.]
MNGLHAQIHLTRGSFELAVDFEVPVGGVLAILGPNGSGKSTVIGCLAGLLHPRQASIMLGGRTLTDLPAHARRVGLLAQDPLLFPHLTVAANVAFAPRSRGTDRRSADRIARRWLAEVDAAEFANRKPGQLSGGQAQRVAVARALAGDPELLLFDEPLAALDVDAAPAVRSLLRRVLHAERTNRAAVLVSHDPLDALALADHVLVMADGRVVERGPTRQVLAAPRTAFTARIAGLNLVAGQAVREGLLAADGRLLRGMLARDAVLAEAAVAVFAPTAVSVYPAEAEQAGSPRNTATATVAALEPHGSVVRVRTAAGGPSWADGLAADLTPAAVTDLALEPGSAVRVAVKATAVEVHPALAGGG